MVKTMSISMRFIRFGNLLAQYQCQGGRDRLTHSCGQNNRELRLAVYELAVAGCTVPEIIAITGHSLENATRVLAHYLFPDSKLAEEAIRKLIDKQALDRWKATENVAEKKKRILDLRTVIRFPVKEAA
jgi:hypothetical protein